MSGTRGLPFAAVLLGAAALVSGAAALALGLREKPAELGPAPALADLAVDVGGGRHVRLRCGGSGSPTVILTAGAGAGASSWKLVQPELARRTRACAWDRAGFGASDASPAPQTAAETTADLRRALAGARITGPLLLVAHSIGSYETLLFADADPARVVGMVLADPSTPDMFRRMAGGSDEGGRAAAAATFAGMARPYRLCRQALAAKAPPPPDLAMPCPPTTPPAKLETALSFFASGAESAVAVVNPARRYGAMPLVVLTAGPQVTRTDDPDPARAAALARARSWGEAHDAIAALSTRGSNRYVPESGHMIHLQRPQAIVEAVDSVLDQLDAG